jgi:hypothetical protein
LISGPIGIAARIHPLQSLSRTGEEKAAGSLKVMRELTDASLSQRSDPEANTLGKVAWHMVVMIGATATAAGIEVVAPQRGTESPASALRIADAFETAARTMGERH